MNDTPYPPEWNEPPDEMDPRLGKTLAEWQPSAPERALTAELTHLYVSRSHTFHTAFLDFCRDRNHAKSWPQTTLALLELFATTAVNAQGEKLTIARLAGDVAAAPDDIIEFGGLS